MTEKKIRKKKNPFKQGAITPAYIAESIEHHQHKTGIGAHEIFLGQVRADTIGDSEVVAIDYTAYEEMAINELDVIREEIFSTYELSCMHIYHSLGRVEVGQICLFIFVSAPHRDVVPKAVKHALEAIKEKLPIFGKEILKDESYVWKENK